MSLVSGRPISFQINLYQPLYVPRSVVEPELFASLRPQAYSGSLTMTPFMDTEGRAIPKLEQEEEKEISELKKAEKEK